MKNADVRDPGDKTLSERTDVLGDLGRTTCVQVTFCVQEGITKNIELQRQVFQKAGII